jgi:hypothetical protein
VRDIESFEGAVMKFPKVFDCGVNFIGLPEPVLLEAMKESEGKLKECLNIVSCGVDKGKRNVVDEKMNGFVKVLFSI